MGLLVDIFSLVLFTEAWKRFLLKSKKTSVFREIETAQAASTYRGCYYSYDVRIHREVEQQIEQTIGAILRKHES